MPEFLPSHQTLTIPKLAIIVAMTRDRVIGINGTLPWSLPDDLRLFRRITLGNTIIMGRETFKAIGRPLPERHNIVLSRRGAIIPGVEVCRSFLEGLATAARYQRPAFAIGGSSVYVKALPIAEEMHVSWVDGEFPGDTFFPPLEWSKWTQTAEEKFSGFRYVHYRRAHEHDACHHG